jgi:hypothetical protein
MLIEALTWLTTPSPDWARQAGYLKELIAIQARHRRWRDQWAPHLEASRKAIEQAAMRCTKRRHAVVYGSGLLLDIPLERLTRGFEKVTLVDAVHLRSTRRKARQFANVKFIEADISGVAAGLLLGAAKGADRLPRPAPPTFAEQDDVDLLISANLITQLPLTPCRFLSRQLDIPNAELDLFARQIMQAHLDHLARVNAVCCLITETRIQHVLADGQIQGATDPLHGLSIPPASNSWQWTIAPLGEVSRAYTVRNNVAAAITMPQCSDSAAIRHGASP